MRRNDGIVGNPKLYFWFIINIPIIGLSEKVAISLNLRAKKKLIRTENESKSEESDQKPENCEKNDIGRFNLA